MFQVKGVKKHQSNQTEQKNIETKKRLTTLKPRLQDSNRLKLSFSEKEERNCQLLRELISVTNRMQIERVTQEANFKNTYLLVNLTAKVPSHKSLFKRPEIVFVK